MFDELTATQLIMGKNNESVLVRAFGDCIADFAVRSIKTQLDNHTTGKDVKNSIAFMTITANTFNGKTEKRCLVIPIFTHNIRNTISDFVVREFNGISDIIVDAFTDIEYVSMSDSDYKKMLSPESASSSVTVAVERNGENLCVDNSNDGSEIDCLTCGGCNDICDNCDCVCGAEDSEDDEEDNDGYDEALTELYKDVTNALKSKKVFSNKKNMIIAAMMITYCYGDAFFYDNINYSLSITLQWKL